MRERFETPIEVAEALARYAPPNAKRILDPAVGNGRLLVPILARTRGSTQVVAVDVDARAIAAAREALKGFSCDVRFVTSDFAKWVCRQKRRASPETGLYDCVVMNPPFGGKKEALRRVSFAHEGLHLPTFVPLEVEFLLLGMSLLRDGGRLLAVLPSTFAASSSWAGVRRFMLSSGRMEVVHELPPFTFAGVESRIYLTVFEKGEKTSRVSLLNHKLHSPDRLVMPVTKLGDQHRLDFHFHAANNQVRQTLAASDRGWCPLESVATIIRGAEPSPRGPRHAVHTCDYRDGFWQRRRRHKKCAGTTSVRHYDLLMARVGRNCSKSLGFCSSLNGIGVSDCLLIIRAKRASVAHQLLFALRTLSATGQLSELLVRGTGAHYVAATDVKACLVPIKLAKLFPREYKRFLRAVKSRDFSTMQRVERLVAQAAFTSTKVLPLRNP